MKTELTEYAEAFEAEVVALKSLGRYEFIKKYISNNLPEDSDCW